MPTGITRIIIVLSLIFSSNYLFAQLSGSYTVGSGGDYPTLQAAANDLMSQGVNGPVTMNILSGTYTEHFEIYTILGTSSSNTVTFQSAAGNADSVLITYNAFGPDSNYVAKLDNVQYVTFRYLSFHGSGSSYSRSIVILATNTQTNNIQINSNIFYGDSLSSNNVRRAVIFSDEENLADLSILNNRFYGGSAGIYLEGLNNNYISGTNIIGNTFRSIVYDGIYVHWNQSPFIGNNDIESNVNGIRAPGGGGNIQIRENRIKAGLNGISIGHYDASGGSRSLIVNNFISVEGRIGISIGNSINMDISYNSVNVLDSYFNSRAFELLSNSAAPVINIVNNNFACINGGYAYYITQSSAVNFSDYNNFYTPGNFIAYQQGKYMTLADLKAGTGQHQNVISVHPHYVTNTDLHTSMPWLDGAGTPLISTNVDIDGEPRDPTSPDIGADEFNANPGSIPYSGTLTIGQGGYFSTIKQAVDSLARRGIHDQLILNLLPQVFNEQVEILSIPGTSAQRKVTFQSQPGDTATIMYTSTVPDSNYILRIKGADNIRLHGLKLVANGNQFTIVLDIYKGVQHLDINGNRLIGVYSTQNDAERSIIFSPDSYFSSRIIQNNIFDDGALGIYMRRDQNNFDYPPGLIVRNNRFRNCGYTGIHLQFLITPIIEKNTIQSGYNGIYISSCPGDIQILKNNIDSDAGYGISIGSSDATSGDWGLIANNFVHVGGVGLARGLSLTTTDYYKVINNSINVTSTSTSTGRALHVNSGNNLILLNNIFENSGGGYAFYISSPLSITNSDYNDIHTNGLNLAYWNGNQTNLAALRVASGLDAHSLSVDPEFVSNSNLHTSSTALNAAAVPVVEVTTDIDGQVRNPLTPDIGADEFGTSGAVTFTPLPAGLTGMNYSSVAWGDFDNDGDLDILMSGARSGGEFTDIYRNDGAGNFTALNLGLVPLTRSAVSWVDFNNDGQLDFIITGSFFGSSNFYTQLYRNEGNGSFTQIAAGIREINRGSMAWGDFDNDGDLDLVLCGLSASGPVTDLYRNEGNETFTILQTGLPNVSEGSVAWGDFDNDGDLDILLSGDTGSFQVTEIYRNDGDGTFTPINANLPGLMSSSVAWGDYNHDGYLDFIITGSFYGSGNFLTSIYKNEGSGQFAPIIASLPEVRRGAVAWGDYDIDGDLDILITGLTGSNPFSEVYRNNGNDNFTSANAGLTAVYISAVAWGDYDSDGDLDILLTGNNGSQPFSQIYRNQISNPNALPGIPDSLNVSLSGTGAVLQWSAASDLETSQTGLNYNLRMGTSPGGTEIVSPMAGSNGTRRIAAMGNVQQNTQWRIGGLIHGQTYYWSVQTLDNLFAGSGFAAEHTFTYLDPLTPRNAGLIPLSDGSVNWGDYDNDGDLDLILTGEDSNSMPVTQLYQNDGQGNFSPVPDGLPDLVSGSSHWADYDNDKDLDILILGTDINSNNVTDIYQNDGAGNFTALNAGLPQLGMGTADWGDFDNDGDPDLLLSGGDHLSGVEEVYRNDGGGLFTSLNLEYYGLYSNTSSNAIWIDYDNDGDLDIFLSVSSSSFFGSAGTSIIQNAGNGTFVFTQSGLPSFFLSSADWGDYDNDGDLDLVLSGANGYHIYAPAFTDIYHNDGQGNLTNLNLNIPGIQNGSSIWGDFDNDGDLDLFLTGETHPESGYVNEIYRNLGNDTFIPVYAGLPDVHNSSAAWGDIDNDGDLDLAIMGELDGNPYSEIFRNNSQIANTPPGSPTNLTVTFNGSGAILGWQKGVDPQTPGLGLSYNLRMGTFPGGSDIISPMAGADGLRRIAKIGNVNLDTLWAIKKLELDSTYYWSVQAIDHNYSGSHFSQEDSFRISSELFTDISAGLTAILYGAVDWGDYDSDGDLDLIMLGYDGTSGFTAIYRNDGLDTFTKINAGLLNLRNGDVAWGDYDNDNDLDILISGSIETGNHVSKIYRNDNGNFVDINAGLIGVRNCNVSWGDYDNDGDLDILLAGEISYPSFISKVYRNDNGVFQDINAPLMGVYGGAAVWGDYDNDGDLDILLCGAAAIPGGLYSGIYRNDNGIFTDINAGLAGIELGAAAWGDYDMDGDLDIVISGNEAFPGTRLRTRIYQNNNGLFSDIQAAILGARRGSVAWGDADNDGDLDLLVTGQDSTSGPTSGVFSKIYRNTNGQFSEVAAGLSGTNYSAAAWGDYDNDEDLDIFIAGWVLGLGATTRIYRNNATFPNNTPSAPQDVQVSVTDTTATFSWRPAADLETHSAALTYNIRLGTTAGGSELVSPMALNNGWSKVVRMGNCGQDTSWTIRNLSPGRNYYWSMQALDNNFAGSAFTPEIRFTTNAPFTKLNAGLLPLTESSAAWGDYDNDDDLDLIVTGIDTLSNNVSVIYNNDLGNFSDIGANITNLSSGTPGANTWADHNNDGDLDLMISGLETTFPQIQYSTLLYANTNGLLVPAGMDFTDVNRGSSCWGDYNNDGTLELLLTGITAQGEIVSKIYQYYRWSFGHGYDDIQADITGVWGGRGLWVDYDNDNDLDVFVCGFGAQLSQLFTNDEGNFTVKNTGIIGVGNADAAWGDYDSDGDMDLAICGKNDANPVTKIYRNDGPIIFVGRYFTDINATLEDLEDGTVAWGDYDNDGDLDLLLTGNRNFQQKTRLYANENGFFNEVYIGLPNITNGTAIWGDYDNDHDLDILFSGYERSNKPYTEVFENTIAAANDPPSVPQNLNMTVHPDFLELSWRKSSDDHTNSEALTYNLRMGYSPGDGRIISPMSGTSGIRQIPAFGNVGHDTTWCIRDLLPGYTYYWSVQAVDNAFTSSAFAPEDSIQIGSATQTFTRSGLKIPINDFSASLDSINIVLFSGTEQVLPTADFKVENVSVTIDSVIHSAAGDLKFVLSHAGIQDTLISRAGGDGDNFIHTVLTDSAHVSIQAGFPPFTGMYRPYNSLSNFAGSDPEGAWILEIYDEEAGNTGQLHQWGLTISFGMLTGIDEPQAVIPTEFRLYQNFPNPFNPVTQIQFDLPRTQKVVLKVYNVLGQLVETLIDYQMSAGRHQYQWQPVNKASGIYFYRLQAGDFNSVKKMILLK
jgi:parallel beta-helix repeat protein